MVDKQVILRFFRSKRLTIILLVAVAIMAASGSILPTEKLEAFYLQKLGRTLLPTARVVGLVNTYRSPVFFILMSSLCLNIVFCTFHRFKGRSKILLKTVPAAGNRLISWLDVVLHFSVIIILAGGLAKHIWGFAGTQYLFLDHAVTSVDEWPTKVETPLGFSVLLKDTEEIYYPLKVRVKLRSDSEVEDGIVLELCQGKEIYIEGHDLNLEIVDVDWVNRKLWLEARGAGQKGSFELELTGGEKSRFSFGGYNLKLTAYQSILKEVRSKVAIIQGGREVKEGLLSPRSKLSYQGMDFFQINWGTDPYGFKYVGVQVSKDPGAPVFWGGCIVFSVVLPVFLILRHPNIGRSESGSHAGDK